MKRKNEVKKLNIVFMLSAWSFIIVLSSFLFLYVGRLIDIHFNTEPLFMIGLFILAIALCIGRIYFEATKTDARLTDFSHHNV